MSDYVIYQGSNDWSALYVDGHLDLAGDHYVIDERLRELVRATTVQSEDFMRGGNFHPDVAPTLDDLRVYTEAREAREDRAEALRAQAAALLAEAHAIETSASAPSTQVQP